MKVQWQILETVPLGKGRLFLERRIDEPLAAYFAEEGTPISMGKYRVRYSNQGKTLIIEGLNEIHNIIKENNLQFEDSVTGHEIAYAVILAALADIWTVVRPSPRYGYLEETYQLPLADNNPRVVGGELRFLAILFNFPEANATVWDVRIRLSDIHLAKKELIKL
jgi:hypothetical protein